MQNLDCEIAIWTILEHQYVLRLHGTVMGFGPFRALVSPWMSNETLNSYLNRRSSWHTEYLNYEETRGAVRIPLWHVSSCCLCFGALDTKQLQKYGKKHTSLHYFGLSSAPTTRLTGWKLTAGSIPSLQLRVNSDFYRQRRPSTEDRH
jgi:hypothetical protein